jgi:hypothetical protein
MPNSYPKRFRYLPIATLCVVSVATLAFARFYVSPTNFDWPAWVQAVGSIAAIVGAFMLARQQHSDERYIEGLRSTEVEISRFSAIRALAANTNALAVAMHDQLDDMYFTDTDKTALASLGDCETAFRGLTLFDIPHEDLVVYCINLPQAIARLRSLMDRQIAYLANLNRIEHQVSEVELRQSFNEVVAMTADIGDLCNAAIGHRRPA